ncbi:hypothetical protein ONZ45_g6772 [Pleurotus djamor]|nr:hypothetical protein ONZ45_g6772 [Pleurotus djamor]
MRIGNGIDTGSAYLPFDPEESSVDNCYGAHSRKGLGRQWYTLQGVLHASFEHGHEALVLQRPVGDSEGNDFEYCNAPTIAIASSCPGSNFIDACIVRNSQSVRSESVCCPVVVKTKRRHEDEIKKNLQITSASIQIMNDDPRRMFTYGLTIAGDAVTSWYFSRSHSAISESFSFAQEPMKFVKLLISFFFSTDEELGYDPNVKLDFKGRYIFSLPQENGPPRLFYAKRSICEDRDVIVGRMTRVWLVTEHWDDPDLATDYVLKDVWIGVSDRTEKQIQTALHNRINEFLFTSEPRDPTLYNDEHLVAVTPSFKDVFEHRVNYKDYFMTIEADFRGQTSNAVPNPAWKKPGVFSLDLPDHAPTPSLSDAKEPLPTGRLHARYKS